MEDRDDYPIIPQPEKKVDFSEYLKLYGTYAEHDQKLGEALKELASLKEENAKLKSIEEKMSPGLLQFIADMFDSLNRVSQMQRPFMWNVGLVRMGDNEVLDNLVNVWAGVGDSNPIKRIEQLLAQRDILRQFITQLSESHSLTDEQKANLTLLMKSTDPS